MGHGLCLLFPPSQPPPTEEAHGWQHISAMPCLIFTGHPSAGKSTLAKIFAERAKEKHNLSTTIISETSACPDHSQSECYGTSQEEKKTRGALKSAFDRALSDSSTSLVILDSLNYIKGFRYELFCISKAMAELHGVVWVLNDLELVQEWNESRSDGYPSELLKELIQRYEPPDSRNRWDQPLYRVDVRPLERRKGALAKKLLDKSVYNMHKLSESLSPVDTVVEKKSQKRATFKRAAFKRPATATTQAIDIPAVEEPQRLKPEQQKEEKEVDCEISLIDRVDEILDSFLSQKPLTKSTSTQQPIASDTNTLHNVDSVTRKVNSSITAEQAKTANGMGKLVFKFADETLTFQCDRRLAVPELTRLRRQYIKWTQNHPPSDTGEVGIARAYLEYIKVQQ